jgi:two-component system LytT family response regulator
MKKVLIADDEAPARQLIREYMADYPDLILLAECNNGVDAVTQINTFRPDLVFLDVQMPGLTGFEVLTHLDEMPQVIFSTAYDQYALQAFDVHALDYLLKPYTRVRFQQAIQRLQAVTPAYWNQLQNLAEASGPRQAYPEQVFVQQGSRLRSLAVRDILRVTAQGDYALIVTAEQSYLSTYGIGELEKKLDPHQFIRVHRSALINLSAVQELQKNPASLDVILQNGDCVRVSRSYMDNLKGLML